MVALVTAGTSFGAASQAHADTLLQVRHDSVGCLSERAARALSSPAEPRRADPGWVNFVWRGGGCVRLTPVSRWTPVADFGAVTLVRNVVPGTGAQFFVPTADLAGEAGQQAPARPSPVRAAGANGSQFCIDNNSTMLLARPERNGSLAFSMWWWTGRGHYFGVGGLASPEGDGWVYREKMASADPDARCEMRFVRLPDGGYALWVTPEGTCRNNGGQGAAPRPNARIVFPARSRRAGIPAGKSIAEAGSMEVGGMECGRAGAGR